MNRRLRVEAAVYALGCFAAVAFVLAVLHSGSHGLRRVALVVMAAWAVAGGIYVQLRLCQLRTKAGGPDQDHPF